MSRFVSVVLRNLTARPIHLALGRVVGRVVAANAVPDAQCSPDLLKKLDDEDPDRPEPVKLSTQQRQDLLLATLQKDSGLDCLKEWLPDLARKAVALLLEFHHIFSLEPNEIGCTDAMEHIIELMKDEPFKERFWRIAPPLVDEVCQHIQEMLDSGAIRPSQSPWCNAVVLVRKKDGLLWFCIYPLPLGVCMRDTRAGADPPLLGGVKWLPWGCHLQYVKRIVERRNVGIQALPGLMTIVK